MGFLLQGVLQSLARLEHDALGSSNGDGLAGAGVDALTLGTLAHLKGAEAGNGDLFTLSASNAALTAISALFLLISVFAATCAIRSVLVIIKASTIFSTFSIRADGLTVWYPFTFRPLPASG